MFSDYLLFIRRDMTKIQALKLAIGGGVSVLAIGFSILIYFSYMNYIDPKHVYGSWVEIGAPSYDTDILLLGESGVYRNSRLVTTEFDFNGKEITIKTGSGRSVYLLTGKRDSPQLKRIEPMIPSKRLIKKGFEHTVDMEGGMAGAKARRAALSDHFQN